MFRPRAVWLGVLTPVLFAAVCGADGILSGDETVVVAASLEILGLGLIAKGYIDLRVRFGRKPALEVLKEWWRELVRDLGGPRTLNLSASAGGIAIAGGRLRAVVRPGPHSTVERRLELLESRVDEADAEIQRVESALNKDLGALRKELSSLSAEFRRQLSEVRALTEESAIGDAGVEVVGWIWLLAGTRLSAIPAASSLLRAAP